MVMNLLLISSKLVDIPKMQIYGEIFTMKLYWIQTSALVIPVNLLRFQTPFLNNIYGGLLLEINTITTNKEDNVISTNAFVLLPTLFVYYSVRIVKPFYYL